MSKKFDPHTSWAGLEQRAETEKNAKRSALARQVRDHMEYEIKGDLDALMGTLTAQPIYHFWGNGEPMVIDGWDAVYGFYQNMINGGANQFHVVVDNIIVDDRMLVTEGQVRQVYRGSTVTAMGVTSIASGDVQPDKVYMSDAQLITVWPADEDGKLIGEDIYFGEAPFSTLTEINEADLPAYFDLK